MHHQPRNHRKTTSQCFNKEHGCTDLENWSGDERWKSNSYRLSSDYVLHGVAEDIKCHVQCSVKATRDTKKEQQPEQTNVNFSLVVSDLEIIEVVETEWHGDTRDFVLSTVQQNGRYAYKMYLKDISADLQTRQNWSRLSPQTSNSTLY